MQPLPTGFRDDSPSVLWGGSKRFGLLLLLVLIVGMIVFLETAPVVLYSQIYLRLFHWHSKFWEIRFLWQISNYLLWYMCDCAGVEIRRNGLVKLLFALLHLVFWIHEPVCDCACLEIQCTGHFKLLIVQLLRYSVLVLSSCCLIVHVLRFSAVISSGCLASAGYLNTWSVFWVCMSRHPMHWSLQAVDVRVFRYSALVLSSCCLIMQVLRFSAMVTSSCFSDCAGVEIQCLGRFRSLFVLLHLVFWMNTWSSVCCFASPGYLSKYMI